MQFRGKEGVKQRRLDEERHPRSLDLTMALEAEWCVGGLQNHPQA